MNHIMIDLETLGTRVNCPVIAIGACYFDPELGDIGRTFDRAINMQDAMRYGVADGGTIAWWFNQSDAARQAAIRGRDNAATVFGDFREFCQTSSPGGVFVWGNGATFDISILEYAFTKILDCPAPWKFWNVRDCRTIKALAEGIVSVEDQKRHGTHHVAVDDAIHQAKWVSQCWQALRSKPVPLDIGELL